MQNIAYTILKSMEAVRCREDFMTATAWCEKLRPVFTSKCETLPLVDMTMLLESACDDLDFLVRRIECGLTCMFIALIN